MDLKWVTMHCGKLPVVKLNEETEKKKVRHAFTVTCIWLLAACSGNVRENLPEHGLEVADSWQEAHSVEPVEAGWLGTLNDPVLVELVAEGMQYNRNLQAVASRLEQAIAQARISGAALLPAAGLGLSGSRSRSEDNNRVSYNSQFEASLNVSWEADIWGRLSAQRAAGIAEAEASDADFQASRLSLAAQIAQAWFGLTEAHLQLEFARKTVQSQRNSSDIVRRRYQRGLTTALDLRLSLSSLASFEADLSQRETEFGNSARRLEVLLGRYPAGAIEAVSTLPKLARAAPAGIPARMLARRPDLVAAKARMVAAGYELEAARDALLPGINLTASVSSQGERLSSLSAEELIANMIGNLTQPLFQGGRLRAQVDLGEAVLRQQLASYAETLLNAFREVEDALLAERLLAEREKHLQQSTEQAVAAEAIALRQYSSGLTQITPLLDAQRRSISAQSQLIGIRRERLNNRITLYLALGGGFSASERDV